MGMSVCAEMEFSGGPQSAQGEALIAGEVVAGSVFVLVEVEWPGGLQAAERFTFTRVTG